MFKMSPKKQRILFSVTMVLIALLVIFIIFRDKFSTFFDEVNILLSVLNPIIVGAVIAYLLNPIEKFFFQKYKGVKTYKTQKFLSIFSAYILIFGLLILFVSICVPQIIKNINELPLKLQEFLTILTSKINDWYIEFQNSDAYASILEAFQIEEFDINEIIQSITETVFDINALLNNIANYAIVFASKLYTGISDALLGFVLSIYILASRDKLKAQARKITYAVINEERADGFIEFIRYTDHTFGGFIQGKLVNAVIIALLTLISFWIFGIPYPQLLALIIGVTDIIPIFGPFIGAIPSAFIVLIAAPEKLIPMLLLILIIQQVDGNYIGPKILGESTGLSALGVFVAIIVMGGYFGIIGMLIGVPTFAVAQYWITKRVNKKLIERGLSADLADYYSDSSLTYVEGNALHKNLFTKIVDPIIKFIKFLCLSVAKFFKKLPKVVRKTPVVNKKEKLVKKQTDQNVDANTQDEIDNSKI